VPARQPEEPGETEPLYRQLYDATFPGGAFIPGYGPPRTYTNRNGDGAQGGNPAFGRPPF
jgi:hypothetical protein